MPGYPIRTPSDHSSVGNSPRNIAASHVLHRLLMPRHPPCALDNLTHTLGANTTKKRPLPTGNTQQSKLFRQNTAQNKDARVHCAILNDHTDPNHRTPNRCRRIRTAHKTTPTPSHAAQTTRPAAVVPSGPNSVPTPIRQLMFPHFSRATPHTFPHPHHRPHPQHSRASTMTRKRYWQGPPPNQPNRPAASATDYRPENQVFGEAP